MSVRIIYFREKKEIIKIMKSIVSEKNEIIFKLKKIFENCGYKVYLDQKIHFNGTTFPIFHTKGVGLYRLDMLIVAKNSIESLFERCSRKNNYIRTAFIEVKKGDKYQNVLNGLKQLDLYWGHKFNLSGNCKF